jgi:hypothetical protein
MTSYGGTLGAPVTIISIVAAPDSSRSRTLGLSLLGNDTAGEDTAVHIHSVT